MNIIKADQIVVKDEKRTLNGNNYSYKLFFNEGTDISSYKIPLYSISVEMKMDDGKETKAQTNNMFRDYHKALTFFQKLVENYCTPIDLAYIIEDELN